MAEFLNTQNAYAAITDIVAKAQHQLVLITPYIKMPSQLMQRLMYYDKNGGNTIIVCRKDDLKEDTLQELLNLKHLDLRYLKELHAKCFYNESCMVITSLNLHDYSQQNNYEMGILLKNDADSTLFNEAVKEANFITGSAVPHESPKTTTYKPKELSIAFIRENPTRVNHNPKPRVQITDSKKQSSTDKVIGGLAAALSGIFGPEQGHCIKCGSKIDFDPEKPYCPDCYAVWSKWKNVDYPAEFCHSCGKSHKTTMAKPLCRNCYDKL
ncbi:PLD-like domain-containing protein [Dehalogenimonas formicexedens]|uniref:PLD-like domain-containing protein n=1 Tax=Dehalogenimonas formicexedens TaxID=1839801 RepID=A0A1P8FA98_9CHLR|nr:phospholipase D-like domain-containing protein [Dehalogenimonas formicexedens]APV45382.1 PLD-like domain-containing protein [Dehalogenimonas formicexedens]